MTGAAGFIGTTLCAELIKRQHQVIGIDNFLNASYSSLIKKNNILGLKTNFTEGFQFKEIDVRFIDRYPDIFDDVECIFNLAAMPGQSKSWSDIELYTSHNIDAVSKLLSMSAPRGIKFIQASTSSVYGNAMDAREDITPRPISPYGITKYAAEQLVEAYSNFFSFDFKILRFFSVYGPRQRPDMGIYRFINQILKGQDITIYGDGSAIRTFTFVDDLVRAVANAGEIKSNNNLFNICGSKLILISDLLEILQSHLHKRVRITYLSSRNGDQDFIVGNNRLSIDELKFEESTSLEIGLEKQIFWFLSR